jgi:hypothetical protein
VAVESEGAHLVAAQDEELVLPRDHADVDGAVRRQRGDGRRPAELAHEGDLARAQEVLEPLLAVVLDRLRLRVRQNERGRPPGDRADGLRLRHCHTAGIRLRRARERAVGQQQHDFLLRPVEEQLVAGDDVEAREPVGEEGPELRRVRDLEELRGQHEGEAAPGPERRRRGRHERDPDVREPVRLQAEPRHDVHRPRPVRLGERLVPDERGVAHDGVERRALGRVPPREEVAGHDGLRRGLAEAGLERTHGGARLLVADLDGDQLRGRGGRLRAECDQPFGGRPRERAGATARLEDTLGRGRERPTGRARRRARGPCSSRPAACPG